MAATDMPLMGRDVSSVSLETGIERTVKKRMGKDDRQFIPFRAISFVQHDRKSLGTDVVTVHAGATKFEWKVKRDAEAFVNEVNIRLG